MILPSYGFKGISDYQSIITVDDCNDHVLNLLPQIKETFPVKKLNLHKINGAGISHQQAFGLLKKLLTIAEVPFSTTGEGKKSALRLKSNNHTLENYIKMSSERILVNGVSNDLVGLKKVPTLGVDELLERCNTSERNICVNLSADKEISLYHPVFELTTGDLITKISVNAEGVSIELVIGSERAYRGHGNGENFLHQPIFFVCDCWERKLRFSKKLHGAVFKITYRHMNQTTIEDVMRGKYNVDLGNTSMVDGRPVINEVVGLLNRPPVVPHTSFEIQGESVSLKIGECDISPVSIAEACLLMVCESMDVVTYDEFIDRDVCENLEDGHRCWFSLPRVDLCRFDQSVNLVMDGVTVSPILHEYYHIPKGVMSKVSLITSKPIDKLRIGCAYIENSIRDKILSDNGRSPITFDRLLELKSVRR